MRDITGTQRGESSTKYCVMGGKYQQDTNKSGGKIEVGDTMRLGGVYTVDKEVLEALLETKKHIKLRRGGGGMHSKHWRGRRRRTGAG